jgi:hypothetical protein
MQARVITQLQKQLAELQHVNVDLKWRLRLEIPEWDYELYGACTAIASLSILSNWSAAKEALLRSALAEITIANPVLSRKLINVGSDVAPRLYAVPAQRVPSDFLEIVEGPVEYNLGNQTMERISQAHAVLEPILRANLISPPLGAVEDGSVLFKVLLISLPDNYVCICPMLSHMIGDGYTYYTLVDHLSAAIAGTLLSKCSLDWSPAPRTAYAPTQYNDHDRFVMTKSWLELINLKVGENMNKPRKATWTVVNKEAVLEIKKEVLLASGQKVSTNDIIVAGLAEVATTPVINVMANMRGRVGGLGPENACNGERVVMLPREKVVANPAYIRREVINTGKFFAYGSGELPEETFKAIERGEGGFYKFPFTGTSNWCSLTKYCEFPGSELMVHLAPGFFVTDLPLDIAIVFKIDAAGSIGLVHNFRGSPQFIERAATSAIFKRITSLYL